MPAQFALLRGPDVDRPGRGEQTAGERLGREGWLERRGARQRGAGLIVPARGGQDRDERPRGLPVRAHADETIQCARAMTEPREPWLSIDLGTCKTCVAVTDAEGLPRMISDASGKTLIPSYVSFAPDGNVLVGAPARDQLLVDPRNTMQCDFRPVATSPRVTRAGAIAPSQLEAIVLEHARRAADAALQIDTRRVVLTLPAGLAQPQRDDVVAAAALAGLEVEVILTAPAAAALAYGLADRPARPIAVYDFGGGKFECTILEIRDGTPVVLGNAHDPMLGGIDLDQRIVDGMIEAFRQVHQIDLGADEIAVERLFQAAEQGKVTLSSAEQVTIRVPQVAQSIYGTPIDMKISLPRQTFVSRTADLVDRTATLCEEAMRQAGVDREQVSELILVGGITRFPSVQERAAGIFGRWGKLDLAPEEVCALGGARYVHAERRKRFVPTLLAEVGGRRVTSPYGGAPPPSDGSPAPLGADVAQTRSRVGRISTKKMFTAVMQAEALPEVTFSPPRPVLTEVTAAKLAVSTVGGFCDEIIAADRAIPASNTRVFTTGKDNQRTVQVNVCQGPSRRFDENTPLGSLHLEGLPPRPRGQVRIAVTFAVDEDGVLEASATDEATGRAQSIRIQLGPGLQPRV
jgi:molecular chaperone DnaK (HSP70)